MQKKLYSSYQIILHWTIASLVLLQLIFDEGIKNSYSNIIKGSEKFIHSSDSGGMHLAIGIIVLILMIFRTVLRIKTGVPQAPSKTPPILKGIAKISHLCIYLLLFTLPITGLIGGYLKLNTVLVLHQLSSKLLIVLVLFHICAAIFHEGVLGNRILHRMFTPEKPEP